VVAVSGARVPRTDDHHTVLEQQPDEDDHVDAYFRALYYLSAHCIDISTATTTISSTNTLNVQAMVFVGRCNSSSNSNSNSNSSNSSSNSSSRACWGSLSVLLLMLVGMMCVGVGDAMPPPVCTDQKLPLSPYAQKLCATLTNIAEFSRAMEEYLDAKVLRNSMALNEPEVKRQDLDHVFLRFGRTPQQ
ncbi:unnamed protein product, partial [Meganyctiphanes norvegica]